MTHHDIVKKLIGKIKPIGETNTDDIRFENLKTLMTLTENLLYDINDIAFKCSKSHEFSIKRAGGLANDFLQRVGKEILAS